MILNASACYGEIYKKMTWFHAPLDSFLAEAWAKKIILQVSTKFL